MAEEPLKNIDVPLVTIYKIGYINKKGVAVPSAERMYDVPLNQIYKYIRSNGAKHQTLELRGICDHAEAQKYKALHFYTMTPAGIFNYRNAKSLVRHSHLMVIDIDDIASHKRLFEIRKMLLDDSEFETELLFVSPSGNGLKWIICVGEQTPQTHKQCFTIVKKYLADKYGIIADDSGSDVCRICYLPYDPECYINPELLNNKVSKIEINK